MSKSLNLRAHEAIQRIIASEVYEDEAVELMDIIDLIHLGEIQTEEQQITMGLEVYKVAQALTNTPYALDCTLIIRYIRSIA